MGAATGGNTDTVRDGHAETGAADNQPRGSLDDFEGSPRFSGSGDDNGKSKPDLVQSGFDYGNCEFSSYSDFPSRGHRPDYRGLQLRGGYDECQYGSGRQQHYTYAQLSSHSGRESEQLSAIPKDAAGSQISGAKGKLESSAPSVAVVSDSGYMEDALASGAASITAKNRRETATADTSVPTPVPSAPKLAFFDDLGWGVHKPGVLGYGWTTRSANVTVQNELAYSSNHSRRFFYKNDADLNRDATAEQRFVFGQDLQEVWLEYYNCLGDLVLTKVLKMSHAKTYRAVVGARLYRYE